MKEKKCVHCLKVTKDITWDHVFPVAWYPDSTPNNISKWKIPACSKCNREYGRVEEDLMIRIGLCLDPKNPSSLGIPRKAIRAISPQLAKNEKDRLCRQDKHEKLMRESFSGANIPSRGVYPNLGDITNSDPSNLLAFQIPAESIRKLNEKIIRGITFLEDNIYIEPPFKINFWAVEDSAAQSVIAFLKRFGKIYAREPGIVVCRVVVPTEGLALFSINIWNRFKMYGSVDDEMGIVDGS